MNTHAETERQELAIRLASALRQNAELLAALKVMVIWAESPDLDGAPSDAATMQAREAIAKAEGRE
jgi:hypothetical protein